MNYISTALAFLIIYTCFALLFGALKSRGTARVDGFQLSMGRDDGRLRVGDCLQLPGRWGALVAFRWGLLMRPVPMLWKPWWRKQYNCWTSGRHWFVMRFPFALPFLSVRAGRRLFYFGGKIVQLNDPEYALWIRAEDFAPDRFCIAPSFRLSLKLGSQS